jgi:phosphoglycolate phosphatase-like HAD superfamily hydrolase
MVGDMPVDIAMAHNAGIRAIGVDYGNATREELEAAEADWIVDDITKILSIIK